MQFFAKFKELYDLEYIIKSYLYVPYKDEENQDIQISSDELEVLLKKKNKNVAGTIFLYNPNTVPLGYNVDEKLMLQDFVFDDKYHEAYLEDSVRIISKALKKYQGKLVEVKYLFNYNKKDIQPTSVLEVFDMDLEKIHTDQLTVFSKYDNFHNYKNISYNGKFIFFAWGHKFDKHHSNISLYASNIAQWAKKTGKDIGFIYDNVKDQEESFEYTRFFSPIGFGKLKTIIPNALETIFSKDKIEPYKIC